MDDAIFIRRYEPRDYDAVWKLHNAALQDAGAHLGNGSWDDDFHDIEGVYLEDGGEFLVGELDGKIVAMGALKRTGRSLAEIKRMRVAPKFQGRGFGQELLALLEKRTVELGCPSLHLDTTAGQLAARVMYAKNGYMETGRGRIGPFERVFMEKELGRSRG